MYRALFENGHVAMLVVDPATGAIVDANPAAAAFYGWTRDELRSMNVSDINTLSRTEVLAEMERARREHRTHFLFPHTLADGSSRVVEVYSGPVVADGRDLLLSVVLDTSQRTREERTRNQEAIRRRVLFDQADDGICLTDEGHALIEANASFAEMTGREPGALEGLHVWDWDARYTSEAALREVWPAPPQQPVSFETTWRRPDGTTLDVEITSSPVTWEGFRGMLHVCRDVTGRKATEVQAGRWARVFEAAGFAVAHATATDNTFSEVNETFARERGYSREELLGAPISILYPPELRPVMADIIRVADRDGHVSAEMVHLRKDGSNFPVLLDLTVLRDESGAPASRVAFALDISARKAAEDEVRAMNESLQGLVDERTRELARANEELRRANEDLALANETKSRFLRAMSHELRTPLNSVIGFSGIMLDGLAGPIGEEPRRQLEMINTAGKHLLELVNDILDLSRIDADRLELSLGVVDPIRIARESLGAVVPAALKRELDTHFEAADDVAGVELVSDPRRIRQVLLNLLGNAVKFTDSGRVVLRVERDGAGAIAFRVCDTGPGIPAAELESIFGEFSQRVHEVAPQLEGTGLGLAISRRLAGVLGGRVDVQSEVGVGSTFSLVLPIERRG